MKTTSSVRACLPLVLLALASATGAAAQELLELRDAFVDEAQMLDIDIDQYSTARGLERRAISELVRLNGRLDEAIADPNASPSALVRLESEIEAARNRAYDLSRDAAEARGRMYERMKRLGDLARQVESLGVDPVQPSGSVGGMWLIDAPPADLVGLLSLRQEREIVTGSYRLSNGRHGSLLGTFAGDELDFQMIDSEAIGVIISFKSKIGATHLKRIEHITIGKKEINEAI